MNASSINLGSSHNGTHYNLAITKIQFGLFSGFLNISYYLVDVYSSSNVFLRTLNISDD
jgi:hypothetical protein